jgi:hypothetical protein
MCTSSSQRAHCELHGASCLWGRLMQCHTMRSPSPFGWKRVRLDAQRSYPSNCHRLGAFAFSTTADAGSSALFMKVASACRLEYHGPASFPLVRVIRQLHRPLS